MNNELNTYIIENYPSMFEFKDGRIFFSGLLKDFYGLALEIYYESFWVYIRPHDYLDDVSFSFTLTLPSSNTNNIVSSERMLRIAEDLHLSDEICIEFFNYDIDIKSRVDYETGRITYDREAIMRRYTINTIINGNE